MKLTAIPVVYRVLLTSVWVLLCAAWLGSLVASAAAPDYPGRDAMFVVMLVIGLVPVSSLALTLVQMHRFAVWVEGTAIVVRHWSGEKRWDLASMTVVVHRTPGVVRLALHDDVSGRRIRLRLRNSRLENVSALAGAIVAARPGDVGARQTAEVLMR